MTTRTLALLLALAATTAAAQDSKPNALTIVDAKGKKQPVKSWSFASGTSRLSWLAGKKKGDVGPLALQFRERHSTTYAKGIQTLILVERIRSVEYDYEKKEVKVRVATSADRKDDLVLRGTATVYVNFNVISVAAEVDKGDFGIAEVKYKGGVKGGIRGLEFSAPTPVTKVDGKRATITTTDKSSDVKHEVAALQALYSSSAGMLTSDTLFFRKTLKIPLSKLTKLAAAGNHGRDWTMALPGGADETFTLLDQPELGKTPVKLIGLIGKVGAGYKVFPMHTIAGVTFGDAAKKKDGAKKDDPVKDGPKKDG